jgi:hypothetical protein
MTIASKYLVPTLLFATHALYASAASAQAEPPDGCRELTPQAFAALIDTLQVDIRQATTDCENFCETGAYASAPRANLDYLQIVLGQVQEFELWLADVEIDTPYITNTSAAYNVHGLARNAIEALHHARHWATISATYHGSSAARDSFDTTTQVIHQLETVGENGGLCYMSAYGPFTN